MFLRVTALSRVLQSGEGGGGMWVHTPDCANEAKVTPVDWRAKAYNATLVGSTWDQLYPLRSTIENALKADLIPGGRVQPHPGGCPCRQGSQGVGASRPAETVGSGTELVGGWQSGQQSQ